MPLTQENIGDISRPNLIGTVYCPPKKVGINFVIFIGTLNFFLGYKASIPTVLINRSTRPRPI